MYRNVRGVLTSVRYCIYGVKMIYVFSHNILHRCDIISTITKTFVTSKVLLKVTFLFVNDTTASEELKMRYEMEIC